MIRKDLETYLLGRESIVKHSELLIFIIIENMIIIYVPKLENAEL
jgi:hypothetical protein